MSRLSRLRKLSRLKRSSHHRANGSIAILTNTVTWMETVPATFTIMKMALGFLFTTITTSLLLLLVTERNGNESLGEVSFRMVMLLAPPLIILVSLLLVVGIGLLGFTNREVFGIDKVEEGKLRFKLILLYVTAIPISVLLVFGNLDGWHNVWTEYKKSNPMVGEIQTFLIGNQLLLLFTFVFVMLAAGVLVQTVPYLIVESIRVSVRQGKLARVSNLPPGKSLEHQDLHDGTAALFLLPNIPSKGFIAIYLEDGLWQLPSGSWCSSEELTRFSVFSELIHPEKYPLSSVGTVAVSIQHRLSSAIAIPLYKVDSSDCWSLYTEMIRLSNMSSMGASIRYYKMPDNIKPLYLPTINSRYNRTPKYLTMKLATDAV